MQAAGRLGWTEDQFWFASPRFFVNALRGHDQQALSEGRLRYEVARYLASKVLAPHAKKGRPIRPLDLGAFEWERSRSEIDPETAAILREQLKSDWAAFVAECEQLESSSQCPTPSPN